VEHASHRLLTEVPAPVLPLVVLVLEHCRGQTQQEVGAGKDAHHLGAVVELGVEPVDGIGRGDRAPVVDWEV
jgi:hypothetical protein